MKTVSAREANQHFSRLLKTAAEGEDVVITRRGKPVAKLVSISAKVDAKRAAAIKRLMKTLRKGFNLGGRPPSREELYDR